MVKAIVPEYIETRLFINGKFVEPSDGKKFTLISPGTLQKAAEVSEASVEDTNAAVAAAKAAFPAWSKLSPTERGKPMKKLAALIMEHADEFAALEAISMGRPVAHFADANRAATHFEHYANEGYSTQTLGSSSLNTPGFVNMTFRQPYGVVAGIIPWNFPLLFFSSKSAPALITGNTVVIKSSEKAPLTSAKMATLIEKAGFPPGVFNVLSGHGQISGATLSSHMDVRVLSFTGSGRTGRMIQAAAAQSNLKNVILELGGKTPAVVFDDADIAAAVKDTTVSIQRNSGQVCMANSRIYVQSTIAKRFIEEFSRQFNTVTMGDPLEKSTTHGPQADELQWNNVKRYLENGKSAGKLVLGGDAPAEPKNGYFINPTIFTEVDEGSQIMKEEVFGPVVKINTFETEEEAIKKANDTEYGLYASVFTKNIDRAMRVAQALEAGTVGVNCTSPTGAHDMPFGGYKASGVGREGWTHSLDNFLETKSVLMKIASS